MDPSGAALVGAFLGAMITGITSLFVIARQNEFSMKLLNHTFSEATRVRISRDLKKSVMDSIEKIEDLVVERRALQLALKGDVYEPSAVMHTLFYKDIWRTAGLTEFAIKIALSFSDPDLANDILIMENLFWKFWEAKKTDVSRDTLDAIESESRGAAGRITSRLVELRNNVFRINEVQIDREGTASVMKLIGRK